MKKKRLRLQALEPRILLDAAMAASGIDAFQETGEQTGEEDKVDEGD